MMQHGTRAVGPDAGLAMDTRPSRPTLWQRLRARPVLTGGVAAAALTGLVIVLVWFQPQALFFDTVVDEEFPTLEPAAGADDPAPDDAEAEAPTDPADDIAAASDDEPVEAPAAPDDPEAPASGATEPAEPAGPVALATGSFEGRSRYTVTGDATVYELPDGSRTLRLEDFESTNGPDLYVYLSSADSADSDTAIDDDRVDLGLLTGNVGNQNYAIPPDLDLDRYDTVVIWCLRFTVGFGAADLVAG